MLRFFLTGKTRKKCPCKRKKRDEHKDTTLTQTLTTDLFINYLPNDAFSNNTAKFPSKIELLAGERVYFILFPQEL